MLKMPHDEKHRVTRRSNLVWHIVMSPQTTQPVAESIKGNHNYLKYNHCTLFAAHRKFLIRTTFLNCLSTSIRTTSKCIKIGEEKSRWKQDEESSRQDRLFPIPSFLDLISRFSLFRRPLAPLLPPFALILKPKKRRKKVYYFIL